jgi:hypothetical protein
VNDIGHAERELEDGRVALRENSRVAVGSCTAGMIYARGRVRIVFSCFPGVGHLHPMLPLMRAARRAGHEVAIATGPDLALRAGGYGFETWTVGLGGRETHERYLARYPDNYDLPPAQRFRRVWPRMFVDIGAALARRRAARAGGGLGRPDDRLRAVGVCDADRRQGAGDADRRPRLGSDAARGAVRAGPSPRSRRWRPSTGSATSAA